MIQAHAVTLGNFPEFVILIIGYVVVNNEHCTKHDTHIRKCYLSGNIRIFIRFLPHFFTEFFAFSHYRDSFRNSQNRFEMY